MAGFVREAYGNFVMSHSDIVKVRGKGVLTDVLEDMEKSIPSVSNNVNTDASSETKAASPKSVKTYVDGICGAILTRLQGI